MLRNVRKVDKHGDPLEFPRDNQNDDARVCVEYWLSRNPTWIEPPASSERSKDPGTRAWERHLAEMDEKYNKQPGDRSISIGIAV